MTAAHRLDEEDAQVNSLAVLALQIALKRVPKREAEEIAQAAVAAFLVRRQDSQNPIYNPEAYVTRIVYNLIYALWRERKSYALRDDTIMTFDGVPDRTQEDPFDRVLDRLLANAFCEENVDPVLTVRERQILELKADGQSRRQIADQLGVAPETVKDAVRRAKRKGLREADSEKQASRPAVTWSAPEVVPPRDTEGLLDE
ncbi:MAG: sigma-70 family RNA polymerase sigma factor [Egibacteraceae bacterium]